MSCGEMYDAMLEHIRKKAWFHIDADIPLALLNERLTRPAEYASVSSVNDLYWYLKRNDVRDNLINECEHDRPHLSQEMMYA